MTRRAAARSAAARRGVGEIVREALLGRGLGLPAVNGLGDHGAHARHGVRERDQPEPAHVGPREHADVPRAPPGEARDALVLRVHRDVAKQGVERVAPELLGEKAGPPGRVDHDARAHRVLHALRIGESERDPGGVEGGVEGAMPLADGHAGLLRVAEQELVERRAGHLEGLGRGGLDRFGEVGVLLGGAVDRPEARPPLPDESGGRRSCRGRRAPGRPRWPRAAGTRRCGSGGTARAPAGGPGGRAARARWRRWSRRGRRRRRRRRIPVARRGHGSRTGCLGVRAATARGSRSTARTGTCPWRRPRRSRARRPTGRSRRRPPSCRARTRCARPGPSGGCP